MDGTELDKKVFELNSVISQKVDCTMCGACCRSLMINVFEDDIKPIADHFEISRDQFQEKFIETSSQGQMILNTIPCTFLSEDKCTIYNERFSECREFPHLHKQNFKGRLFATLVHYATCPIIFNVIEDLKIETGYK